MQRCQERFTLNVTSAMIVSGTSEATRVHPQPTKKADEKSHPPLRTDIYLFDLENELHHEPAGKPVVEDAILPVSRVDCPVLRWI